MFVRFKKRSEVYYSQSPNKYFFFLKNMEKLLKKYNLLISQSLANDGDYNYGKIFRRISNEIHFDKFGDTWLLLSLIFTKFEALSIPKFYFIDLQDEEKRKNHILRVKYLIWLENVYRNSHDDKEIKNSFEYIRKGMYNDFISMFGDKNEDWKAEIYRGLYDYSTTRERSLRYFLDYSEKLCQSNIPDDEKQYFKALDGDESAIISLLQKDEHNHMWAKLFSSFILKKDHVDINIDNIKDSSPLTFQRFCFQNTDGLIEKLKNADFLQQLDPSSMDENSIAFYLNLSIILNNKIIVKKLLPIYLRILMKYNQYQSVNFYLYGISEGSNNIDVIESETALNLLINLAAEIKPYDYCFISTKLENKQDLLLLICKAILDRDWENPDMYLNISKWLQIDQDIFEKNISLPMQAMYKLILKNEFQLASQEYYTNLLPYFPQIESKFWDSFLKNYEYLVNTTSEEEENNLKKYVKTSFKALLEWSVALKGENGIAVGYEEFKNSKEFTNTLINSLFIIFTRIFQENAVFINLNLMKQK